MKIMTIICAHYRWRLLNVHFPPIMLTLYADAFSTYYAQNYAGIIGAGLSLTYLHLMKKNSYGG